MHNSSLGLVRVKYPSGEYSYKIVTALMENYENISVRYLTFDDRSGETYTL
jgi:hypothetical protein